MFIRNRSRNSIAYRVQGLKALILRWILKNAYRLYDQEGNHVQVTEFSSLLLVDANGYYLEELKYCPAP